MTPQAPDYGHRETDRELLALSRRLHLSYRQAKLALEEKITKYLEQFEKEDAEKRALYDSGELSHEEYTRWKYSTLAGTKQWKRMLNQLADDMTHQNQIAASMIDDTLPDVYALNHNYGTYEAEVGSGFDTTYTMYDKSTVKRLLTEHEDLLPHPSVPIEKDKLWNKQHLQSALLQGILTGEPMGDIAKRFQSVTDMTERAAMRNARTAVTGAENAGRIDSYIRAQNMGIKMKQMWMATLDGRTRDSHAMMDGEQQEVGRKFSNGCRYPGDPQGAPAEVYNCRCSAVAVVEGADPYNPNLRPSEYLKEEGLTYEQWKEMHGERFYSKLFEGYEPPKIQHKTYNSIAEVNKEMQNSLVEMYERHRIENNLRQVPYADIGNLANQIIFVNYDKLSIETAQSFTETIQLLAKQYDTPLEKVRMLNKEEFISHKNSFAFVRHNYDFDNAELVINPAKCKDKNALVEKIQDLGKRHYCISVKPGYEDQYVATHEFAHTILNCEQKLNDKRNFVNADYDKIREARKEISLVYEQYLIDVKNLESKAKNLEMMAMMEKDISEMQRLFDESKDAYKALNEIKLSDYSLSNVDDFMAEAFTNEKIGIQSKKYGQDVLKIIDKYFKR